MLGRGQYDGDARAGRDARCVQLRGHASGADARRTRRTGRDAVEIGVRAHLGDQPCARAVRRPVVQAVDVGQQEQQVRVDEVRDKCREPVVVAEPDLGGGDRVVLVDDRDHAQLEQLAERLVRVAVVRATGDVVEGQQHLPGGEPVPRQLLGVAVHEQALADRRRGLLRGQVARPLLQPERCQAGGDRTGATRARPRHRRPELRRARRRAR